MELNKKVKTLTRTQSEIKMTLKTSITLLENSKESFTNRMNWADDVISICKENAKALDQVRKKSERKKSQARNI